MLSTRLVSELGDVHSTLRTTMQRSDWAVIIYAGGEVDACNEHAWRGLLSEVAAGITPPDSMVVDLTGLGFMGSCAFAALAEEADRCRHRGVELRLVSNQPTVARIVRACGFGELLPVYSTEESAASA